MQKDKVMNGVVKIAFSYLFLLVVFIIYRLFSMEVHNYMEYFANFIFFFIPFGIPAWILLFVHSLLKKKTFKPDKPEAEAFDVEKKSTILDKDEIIEEK